MSQHNQSKKSGINRRDFISRSALAAAGFSIVPRYVLGGPGYIAPSDKLNIAGIGVGGRGHGVLSGVSGKTGGKVTQNIVALCDVDQERAERTYKMFPKAKKYKDFRVMFDEMLDDIDAVTVATPDHTHAPIAMAAMRRGKHVYVEKPLTHNVYEARMLTEAARKYNIVSQMGNQGSSSDDIRKVCEWIWSGAIGEVKMVHCWTNRPVWLQNKSRPTEKVAVPKTLDWDLWLGPAEWRDYHPDYLPFAWRGWWDFGTGALGDMACHIIDPAFRALKLGYPDSVEASASVPRKDWAPVFSEDSPPNSSLITYKFPAREGMPPVTLKWYDGGLMPTRPEELRDDEEMGDSDGGVIFEGTKGKLMCGVYARNPVLLPTSRMEDFKRPEETIPRVKGNHQTSWVEACKGGPAPSSNFDYAGPLSETVLMGNLAIRSFFILEKVKGKDGEQFTGRKRLDWDGKNMKITNYEPANRYVKREYRDGWSLEM